MREPGFYWVRRIYGEWEVAEWDKSAAWLVTGVEFDLEDKRFSEIDERRIVREEGE